MAGAKAQKRKSLENQTPGKKMKMQNGSTEGGSPKKPFIKNSPQKQGNKKNQKDEVKKPKPFAGTKQLNEKPKAKQEKGVKNEKNTEGKSKKKRSAQYYKLKDAVTKSRGESDPEVVKALDEKINAIASRPDLSKTAKRKLSFLKKLKAVAEGKVTETKTSQKSEKKAKKDKKKKPVPETKVGKQKPTKQIKAEQESDDDDDDDDEDDAENGAEAESSDEEEAEEEEGEEDSDDAEDDDEAGEVEGEEADSDDDDDEEEGDAEENDDDDESDEEPAPKEKQETKKDKEKHIPSETEKPIESKNQSKKEKTPKLNPVNVESLKNNEIIEKAQKRYVLFVGNIPYDTTREDLKTHFSKIGEILHIRLPLDQKSNKPRGFAYVEVKDEETYQKCLSMHHSQIKGRRINVLYTQAGKKKSDSRKNDIKVKNMKLHAMRKQGQLAGSTKHTQTRAFRRKKMREIKAKKMAKTD